MDKWEYGVSSYFKYRNQSISWLPSDTKQLYDYNLKHNYDKLEKQGWIDVDIKYSFNEHGFRSDSFQKDCTILFNGCSQTVGVGISLDMMWSKMIVDHYDVFHHNIAIGGSDWSYATQRALYWIPILKPKIYIFKQPPMHRLNWWISRELCPDEIWYMQSHQGFPEDSKYRKEFLELLVDERNQKWRYYSNTILVKQICKEYNCRFISIGEGLITDGLILARDLMHYGNKEQLGIFHKVVKLIEEDKDYEELYRKKN